MIGDFDTILNLVGTLDDSAGDDTPRERFRKYLATGLTELGAVRDAVQTCVTHSGPQYARALQDLVNWIGDLIGFDVEYGRYAGVVNQIGHDGLWRSGARVVVLEVKTTDAYTINSATLLNYINDLRSEGRITPDDRVIGLYVYARVDPQVKQLEHAIVAEKRTQELRVGSVDSVLSLAELIREELIGHDEAIAMLWPSGVWIDDTVSLLSRVAAGTVEAAAPPTSDAAPGVLGDVVSARHGDTVRRETLGRGDEAATHGSLSGGQRFFMTPVANEKDVTARETIERLVGTGVYAFGDRTPRRRLLKPGDRICFYENSAGVVAEAEVASVPEHKPLPQVKNSERYPWTFKVSNARFFFNAPIAIDATLRAQLDAFADKEPQKAWAWFVQQTKTVSEHDYRLLTRGAVPEA